LKQPGFGIYGIAGIGNGVNIEGVLIFLAGRLLYSTKPISFLRENLRFNFITAGKSQVGL
jgi:hypothetical protein